MNVLIVKLGATGDVVRTTSILRRLEGPCSWLTSARNRALVEGTAPGVAVLSWEERDTLSDKSFDLVINLEDEQEVGAFVSSLRAVKVFGAYLERTTGLMKYTPDSSAWFDLSLISVHGRQAADRLKLQNRCTYQEHLFRGLGFEFSGEQYFLPKAIATGLCGDIAISPVAGPIWPMKAWAYYDELRQLLEAKGFVVNVLPTRDTLLEHLGDVQGHQCLVSGDSLPMHLALGSGVRCVSLFNCTSPWEIYDYGIQTKIVSPLLQEHFYKRGFDVRATTAIPLEEVFAAVMEKLRHCDKKRDAPSASDS